MASTSEKLKSIAQQEMVTRPALWGLVIFLFSFSLVLLVVTLYQIYKPGGQMDLLLPLKPGTPDADMYVQESFVTNPDLNQGAEQLDSSGQVEVIEQEVNSLDQDIEAPLSDQELGL